MIQVLTRKNVAKAV